METTIRRLRKSHLSNSLSFSNKLEPKIYESQWQVEFYLAGYTVLQYDHFISPDVGKIYNSNGFVDFFINDKLKWAIELTREFNDIQGHIGRFEEGG